MRTAIIALVVAAVVVAGTGCAATNSAMLAALAPVDSVPVPVICDAATCPAQWERAQIWIVRYSRYRIQTANDVSISTFSPDANSFMYGFVATKEPADGGRHRISVVAKCYGEGFGLGCRPKEVDVKRAFYYYVETGKDILEGLDIGNVSIRNGKP